jgi:rubrerythrin
MNLKNSKTLVNLAKTYAGECMARTRYEFMEYGFREQGFKAVADLIDYVAYNEFNHARMVYSFIQTADPGAIADIRIESGYPFKEKWNLLDNLRFAMEDEKNEGERIYPEFMKVAEQEGFTDIAGMYRNLISVELQHMTLFKDLHDQMKNGCMYKKQKSVSWKCSGCGYEHQGKEAPDTCPLCQTKQSSFFVKLDSATEHPMTNAKFTGSQPNWA